MAPDKMNTPGFGLLSRDTRSDWVRLRTLILLRWMAITGQLAAITVADRAYGMQLPLGLCYLAVGASIIANLILRVQARYSHNELIYMD